MNPATKADRRLPVILGGALLIVSLITWIQQFNPGHQYELERAVMHLRNQGAYGREFERKILADAPDNLTADFKSLGASDSSPIQFTHRERSTDTSHPADTYLFTWSNGASELVLTACRNPASTGYQYLTHEIKSSAR